MSADTMLELAERCERATGADRELDCLIRLALFAPPEAHIKQSRITGAWRIFHGTRPNGDDSIWESSVGREPYTASLDAAMTLKPAGWTLANLSESDNRGWWAELRQGFLTSYDKTAFARQLENGSPALALCAAALRARAAMERPA